MFVSLEARSFGQQIGKFQLITEIRAFLIRFQQGPRSPRNCGSAQKGLKKLRAKINPVCVDFSISGLASKLKKNLIDGMQFASLYFLAFLLFSHQEIEPKRAHRTNTKKKKCVIGSKTQNLNQKKQKLNLNSVSWSVTFQTRLLRLFHCK